MAVLEALGVFLPRTVPETRYMDGFVRKYHEAKLSFIIISNCLYL